MPHKGFHRTKKFQGHASYSSSPTCIPYVPRVLHCASISSVQLQMFFRINHQKSAPNIIQTIRRRHNQISLQLHSSGSKVRRIFLAPNIPPRNKNQASNSKSPPAGPILPMNPSPQTLPNPKQQKGVHMPFLPVTPL